MGSSWRSLLCLSFLPGFFPVHPSWLFFLLASHVLSKWPATELHCASAPGQGCFYCGMTLTDLCGVACGEGTENSSVRHGFLFPIFLSRGFFISYRRFLNKSSEDDGASERLLPSEGTSSDPVTLRRRMLAAAAERRLQRQQTT